MGQATLNLLRVRPARSALHKRPTGARSGEGRRGAGGAQAGAGVPWGGWGAGVCPVGQVGCRRHRCAQTSGEQGTELVPIQNFPVSGMVLAS